MDTAEARRNTLKTEFERFLEANPQIFIYGAGIVGKRLYRVIDSMKYTANIVGFIVSNRGMGTPEKLFNKRVFEFCNIDNRNSCILVAVSEAYQNEILYILKEAGYNHVFNGYIYSYLCEEYIPEYMPLEVPDIISIDKNELMMMQFSGRDFLRYDLLTAFDDKNNVFVCDEYVDKTIVVDPLFRICDDADKAVGCLKNTSKKVRIERDFKASFKAADRKWLMKQKNGQETALIDEILKEKILEWKKPMYAIVWPPAIGFADGIAEEMKETAELAGWLDIRMNRDEFINFVRKVYSTDDVEEWQIQTKLRRMIEKDCCRVRIVKFYLNNPQFRIKRFGHTISGTGVEMKERIRDKHKHEIDHYIKDIIIHTTDNYEQAYLVSEIVDGYLKKGNRSSPGDKASC